MMPKFGWELEIEDEVTELYLVAVEQYFWFDEVERICKISTPMPKSLNEWEIIWKWMWI